MPPPSPTLHALSADGSRLVVGAPRTCGSRFAGNIHVYRWHRGDWQRQTTIAGLAPGDAFGSSVAVSADGSHVAAGAPCTADAYVRVFGSNGAALELADELSLPYHEDDLGRPVVQLFGNELALSSNGSRLVVGAPGGGLDGSLPGSTYVYERGNDGYAQLGASIDGDRGQDRSGSSIALTADGNRLAIGEPEHDGSRGTSGRVRVFAVLPETVTTAQPTSVPSIAGELPATGQLGRGWLTIIAASFVTGGLSLTLLTRRRSETATRVPARSAS